MSIASRITEMEQHITNAYDGLEDIGADLTNIDKNINNISTVLDNIWNDLPKVTATDVEEASLENTKKGRINIDLKSNTEQEQLSGKNKLQLKDGTYTSGSQNLIVQNGIASFEGSVGSGGLGFYIPLEKSVTLSNGETNTFSVNIEGTVPNYRIAIRLLKTNYETDANSFGRTFGGVVNNKATITATQEDEETYTYAFLFIIADTSNLNFKAYYQLEQGSTATDFEPFCGGIPAPNPSYEIPVHNVKGSNEFKIQSKNLFDNVLSNDITKVNCTTSYDNGEIVLNATGADAYIGNFKNVGSSYTTNCGQLIKVKPNTTYTLQNTNSLFNKNLLNYWNKDIIVTKQKDLMGGSSTRTFTTDADTEYITVRTGYSQTVGGQQYKFNVMVIEGSYTSETIPSYVPYQEQNLPLDLRSKNLLENTGSSRTLYGLDFTVNQDGTVKANGTATQTFYFIMKNNITLKPGTFTLSGCPEGGSLSTYYLALSIIGISTQFVDTGNTHTRTLNESYTNVSYYIFIKEGTTVNNLIFKPQFEQGSTATDYVPYYNYELSTVGEAEDNISKEDGKWYLNKEVGKFIANYDFESNGETENTINLVTPSLNVQPNSSTNEYKSNIMTGAVTNYTGMSGTTSQEKIRIILSKKYASTHAEASTFLTNKKFEIYYPLATPTKIEITETTLINQLEAIRKAQSYNDQTNISQTNEDLPFKLDITALKK